MSFLMKPGLERILYDQIADQLALPIFTRTIQVGLRSSSRTLGQMSREFQDMNPC